MKWDSISFWLRNGFGAFADAAILFPLLSMLSFVGGLSSPVLLASSGAFYLVAAFLFRVPMAVQPLKSIAIAAVAIGATSFEIRLSGALLGLACLALLFLDVDRLADQVPLSLIHGLQLALGILLVLQGFRFSGVGFGVPWDRVLVCGLSALLLLSPRLLSFPLLGLFATSGLVFAFWKAAAGTFSPSAVTLGSSGSEGLRLAVVASLVFPQLALTLANSVLATRNVAIQYFGEHARARVTPGRLLSSIGFGNVLSAFAGGLPFCHGSGGVTAHFRGGATHWVSNAVIGVFLLGFACFQFFSGYFQLEMPKIFLSSLLITTGVFHLGLARPTWGQPFGKWKLLAMGLAAVVSQNMLVVLGIGLLVEFCVLFFNKEVRA